MVYKGLHEKPNVSRLFSVVEVLRKGAVVSSSNVYTPVTDDRDGITLRCSDTVHSRWRVQEDIVKSIEVKPKCRLFTIAMYLHGDIITYKHTSTYPTC